VISDKAIISPKARIGKNVTIGPFSVIGDSVEIGDDCWIGPHVVLNGPTTLGKGNKIFQFASVGEDPQDKKFIDGENSRLIVGDNNIFREFSTVSRGTAAGLGVTTIGNDNLFMAYVHIAHDCTVGNGTVFSNNASLAGHVTVDDFANLSGFVGVHQFCRIGKYSFCAGGSIIVKDVLPFTMVSGYPAQAFGLNTVGLKRRHFSEEAILNLKRAYKTLLRQGLSIEDATQKIAEAAPDCQEVESFVSFAKSSERGVVR
jgi:UDP-N-acetylglucosamine acyltransferase